jgi:hypothetical protein
MFLVTLVKENCGVYPIIQKHLPIRTDLWDGFHCWLYYGLPTIPRYKECICWLICLDTLTKKSKKNVLLVYYVILKYVSWTPRQGQAFFLRRAIFVFFFFIVCFPAWLCGFCGCVAFVALPCFTYLSILLSIYLI